MTSKVLYDSIINATNKELLVIAELIYDLDIKFYGELGGSREQTIERIKDVLLESNTDLGCGCVARIGDKMVGYFSCFPLNEKNIKNLASMKVIMHSPEYKSRYSLIISVMKTFQKTIAPIKDNVMYLNKLIVLSEFKGKGISDTIFKKYEAMALECDLETVFHVESDNLRAINFYKRHGYKFLPSEHSYITVKK